MKSYTHLIGKRVRVKLGWSNEYTPVKWREGTMMEHRSGPYGVCFDSDCGKAFAIQDGDIVESIETASTSDLTRIYIAGPMSKYKSTGFNFRAFYDAEAKLKNNGYEVVNPARMDNEAGFDENATYSDEEIAKRLREWFPRDVAAIATCGHVYLLDGWQDSRGATIEKLTSELLGLKVHYQTQPNVCTEAVRLVYGDRGVDYGHPSVEHKRIADYWSVYIADARGLGDNLTEQDVAMMMILLKIARQGHKFKLDNVIDIAGYALCAHRMADRSLP